jgi:hypothetical protein
MMTKGLPPAGRPSHEIPMSRARPSPAADERIGVLVATVSLILTREAPTPRIELLADYLSLKLDKKTRADLAKGYGKRATRQVITKAAQLCAALNLV